MNLKSILSLATAALLLAAPAAFAQTGDQAASSAPTPTAPADYPLKTCIVSGEELGSMGDAFEHIHKEEGKPDRLVRMCCEGCLKKFNKEPAKYLARLDAAEAEAAKKSGAKR